MCGLKQTMPASYGEDGRLAARALNEARGALLNQTRYAGKSGRLVKWYGRSVKWSGNVNETTLYRQVLGPLGLFTNVFSGVSARMALAFTRNGLSLIHISEPTRQP